jgi:hypothetical protein
MSKTQVFSLKIMPKDAETFREQATALGLTNADYFRLLISQRSGQESLNNPAIDDKKLDSLEGKISSVEAMVKSMMSDLVEQQRIPSFYEFRARIIAETNPTLPKSGSERFGFFLDAARRYHRKYEAWPDPANRAAFGPGLDDQQLASWPSVPR